MSDMCIYCQKRVLFRSGKGHIHREEMPCGCRVEWDQIAQEYRHYVNPDCGLDRGKFAIGRYKYFLWAEQPQGVNWAGTLASEPQGV